MAMNNYLLSLLIELKGRDKPDCSAGRDIPGLTTDWYDDMFDVARAKSKEMEDREPDGHTSVNVSSANHSIDSPVAKLTPEEYEQAFGGVF